MKTFLQFSEAVAEAKEMAVDDATIKAFKKKMDEIKKMISEVSCPKAKQTMQSYYYSFYSGVRNALMQSKYAEVWPEENPSW
jgi:DNA-binding GntR family transcriptional regulator